MHIDSPLVFRHAQRLGMAIALAVIAFVALALLGYAVTQLIVTGVPSLDLPDLAPFRWTPLAPSFA